MDKDFLTISFRGKDLLEASGMPEKASYEFKDLIKEIASSGDSFEEAVEKVHSFSLFVYGNLERSKFFNDTIELLLINVCEAR